MQLRKEEKSGKNGTEAGITEITWGDPNFRNNQTPMGINGSAEGKKEEEAW